MDVRESIKRIRKAIVVAAAGGIVVALGKFGVIAEIDTVETLVTFGITAFITWAVPNSKEYLD